MDNREQVPSKRPAPASSSAKPRSSLASSSTAVNPDDSDDDDEGSSVAARRKRPSLGRGVKGGKAMVLDSEEDEESAFLVLPRARAAPDPLASPFCTMEQRTSSR